MQTQTADRIARDLITQGYAVFTEHVSWRIPPLIAGFKQLLKDPHRDQWAINVKREGSDPNEPDDGLIRKARGLYGSKPQDNKWFFHYRTSLENLLVEQDVPYAAHTMFLENADNLHGHCQELVLEIAKALDRQIDGFDLKSKFETGNAQELDVLRLLVYDVGTEIGKAHIDLSALTLHIAENRPGLRIGPDRIPYVAQPNQILVFCSRKIERITNGVLKAVEHDVVTPPDTTNTSRWSVIYFAHTA